jgi:hypothetical protein
LLGGGRRGVCREVYQGDFCLIVEILRISCEVNIKKFMSMLPTLLRKAATKIQHEITHPDLETKKRTPNASNAQKNATSTPIPTFRPKGREERKRISQIALHPNHTPPASTTS